MLDLPDRELYVLVDEDESVAVADYAGTTAVLVFFEVARAAEFLQSDASLKAFFIESTNHAELERLAAEAGLGAVLVCDEEGTSILDEEAAESGILLGDTTRIESA